MKAVILAGGLGTRISEETTVRPKPMIEIGGMPVLWHILKTYSHHGINDFIICLGYKGYVIKEYFANYFLKNGVRDSYNGQRLQALLRPNKPDQWAHLAPVTRPRGLAEKGGRQAVDPGLPDMRAAGSI
ncbi:MAG TPA: sugar phosphate nucleotidyltransferase [Chiayiivirga sp.]|nr:sugar phosphate nucleotidyltransferase [Chiayiivirga sp.]